MQFLVKFLGNFPRRFFRQVVTLDKWYINNTYWWCEKEHEIVSWFWCLYLAAETNQTDKIQDAHATQKLCAPTYIHIVVCNVNKRRLFIYTWCRQKRPIDKYTSHILYMVHCGGMSHWYAQSITVQHIYSCAEIQAAPETKRCRSITRIYCTENRLLLYTLRCQQTSSYPPKSLAFLVGLLTI